MFCYTSCNFTTKTNDTLIVKFDVVFAKMNQNVINMVWDLDKDNMYTGLLCILSSFQ